MFGKVLMIAILGSVATGAVAQGQKGGAPMMQFVEEWDQNADGTVTVDDIATRRADLFIMFDQSNDGQIDAEEQVLMAETIAGVQGNHEGEGHGTGGPGQMIHGAMTLEYNDTDADGIISAAEFDAGSPKLFAELDADADGVVTPADFGR